MTFGVEPIQGMCKVIFNTDELENFSDWLPAQQTESILIIGMENTTFRHRAQITMARLRPRGVITLGVATDHDLYPNGTHLDLYLRDRAHEGNFLGLAICKNFLNSPEDTPDRGEVVSWIKEAIDGHLVEASLAAPDVHLRRV